MLCPLEMTFSDWPSEAHLSHPPEVSLPALATPMPTFPVGGLARPGQQNVFATRANAGACVTSLFLLKTRAEDRTGRRSPKTGSSREGSCTQVAELR